MQEKIGEHFTWQWPVLGTVHSDTIVTTWIVMLVSLAFFAWIGASYRSPRVSKRQTVIEGVINYIADLANGVLGEQGEPFVPFFITLFIFIFLLNQFGFLPFKPLGLPFGGSPTADLNTTAAYALMVFILIQAVGLKKYGLRFYAHLLKPFPILAPINLLEELARPATLAARLFFNIFVGELLFIIIASIITAKVMIGPVNLSLAVTILPFFIQFFNFFVGTVQAFLFTLLAIVYLSLAVAEEH
ncbi:MAG TPA: F0F1 ATP synthase subunit A [Candidatus Baltobacteraceae bacterium]|nr:F0F1 ATP synthase subunit A [Candidatus Baltobacteraceae bacterium]